MTDLDTDNVTPLRPTKAKRADNTAALRQRRSRAKRKPSVTAPAAVQISGVEKANEIKADVTVLRGAMNAIDVTGERGATHSSASASGPTVRDRLKIRIRNEDCIQ